MKNNILKRLLRRAEALLAMTLVAAGIVPVYGGIVWADDIPVFDKESFLVSAQAAATLRIGMVDCVAMALKNNSDILIKKIVPQIEDSNVRIQKSRFEPNLSFDWAMEDTTDLSTTTLSGFKTTKTRTGRFDFGFDEKFVTGTELNLDFFNTRTRSNSAIQTLNPEFDSEAQVTITQPLLKGFGIIVNKADFLIAKNNRLKSAQDFRQEVIKVLTDVKKNYYDFQYTQEQYKVAQVSLKRVQNLHDINKEKYAKGLASNVDLLQSESEVARFEEALLAAEKDMKLAEDNLKFITNLVDDPGLWNANIILLDGISYERKDAKLIDAIILAFDHRPDYEAAKFDLKNRDISVIFYRNNMLPRLDLTGSFGLNGLGKTFEKDMGNVGGGKYQDWLVGVTFRLPLFSDEEKGKYEKSKFEKLQALIAFKRLEQKIILQVRDKVRKVEINYKMLEASKKSNDAEEENYSAQETRFRAGLVSTLDIVIFQERLARSEVNYVKSIIDYNISLIELAKEEGMTLANDGIIIEGA
ncbi:MAG: TolC family protein [Candidatus Omnitrophota bacterium]|nr:TolC family protein [Candidatus Omnitrophota bacterium]